MLTIFKISLKDFFRSWNLLFFYIFLPFVFGITLITIYHNLRIGDLPPTSYVYEVVPGLVGIIPIIFLIRYASSKIMVWKSSSLFKSLLVNREEPLKILFIVMITYYLISISIALVSFFDFLIMFHKDITFTHIKENGVWINYNFGKMIGGVMISLFLTLSMSLTLVLFFKNIKSIAAVSWGIIFLISFGSGNLMPIKFFEYIPGLKYFYLIIPQYYTTAITLHMMNPTEFPDIKWWYPIIPSSICLINFWVSFYIINKGV